MPWWVWLVLVLFMLVMIVSGIVYACLHGYHAFKDMAKLGECAAKRIDAMGKPLPVSYTHLTLPTTPYV